MRDTMHREHGVGLAGVPYVDRVRTSAFTTLENLERFWKDLPTSDILAKLKSGDRPRTLRSKSEITMAHGHQKTEYS
jgi:hypothetical protein